MKKKKGFTLAEVLIAVAIIGVISAIMIPLISKFKPDTDKIEFLKAYDALDRSVEALINDQSEFPILNEKKDGEEEDHIDYRKYPLYNLKVNNAESFCDKISKNFNVATNSCNTENHSFTTKNGVTYSFAFSSEDSNGSHTESPMDFRISSTMQIGEKSYDIAITADGQIVPYSENADAENVKIAQNYLRTRSIWKRAKSVGAGSDGDLTLASVTNKLHCFSPYFSNEEGTACVITCWNGDQAIDQSLCPQKITCWNNTYATDESLCPQKITCWNGAQVTDINQCPSQITCWNGVQVADINQCPPQITCWNGAQVTDMSQCSPLPIWDVTYAYNIGVSVQVDRYTIAASNEKDACAKAHTRALEYLNYRHAIRDSFSCKINGRWIYRFEENP